MEHSHILLNFLVIITMVLIISANDGGYKILSYGENFPAYLWQRVNHREKVQHVQRRDDDDDSSAINFYNRQFEAPENANGQINNTKRKSNFEEEMAELNHFERDSGAQVVYGQMSVPVILLTSYEKKTES